jgi:hypothetical protein
LFEQALTSMDGLKQFARDIEKIEKEIADIQDEEFEAMFTGIAKKMQTEGDMLSEQVEQMILKMHGLADTTKEKFTGMSRFIQSAFQGMSNVISDALNSTENIFKAFGKFFADFIKGMIIKLVAATTAALALAVILTFILPGGSVGKIFTSLEEGAKFVDVFKAGFKTFARFQGGGVVPPGYPNDTYPALLTSGEAVIPAKQLAPTTIGSGEVIFRIDGYELVGILKKQMSLEQNY